MQKGIKKTINQIDKQRHGVGEQIPADGLDKEPVHASAGIDK